MRTIAQSASVVALAALTFFWSTPAEAKFVSPYNHPDLEWFSIDTEHFVVHYAESRKKDGNPHYLTTEWTARKSAKVAEEMWPRMCAEFNYFLKEKVHIVLLNHGDELEGFTIPAWDWIEISSNPGTDFYRQRGRMDWLPDVLVHEFAHVISLKAQASLSEGTQGILIGGLYSDGFGDSETGAEIFIGDTEPFYWAEGGAEYWSDEAGYNWWTPSRDMHIRTTVLEDRLLSYDEWQSRAQAFRWGDGERGYQQGYSFALYLRQRFGNDTYEKFALENAKGWRADWATVIEDVTGVGGRQLYDEWAAYITKRYDDQYARVKAEGEVVGRELLTQKPAWDVSDPSQRDTWMDPRWKRKEGVTGRNLARIEREKAKEATGTWQMVPQFSADGAWQGVNSRGYINLQRLDERSVAAFEGTYPSDAGLRDRRNYSSVLVPADFMHAWDFVPNEDAVVVVAPEDSRRGWGAQLTGVKPEFDGYNWDSLWVMPIPEEEERDGRVSFVGHKGDHVMGRQVVFAPKDWAKAKKIPNTLRAGEPSVSPDGKRVVYLEFTDGTLNLAAINLDGSDKKLLTSFDDGTWLQRADWSPDGKRIVLTVFRNFQQDLYIMDADGSNVRPIMYDRWEDMDPHWSAVDGRIYFSSDHSGIFNVYAYDPSTERIHQITNVIGGAEAPSVTPQGNLLYSYYTGHGWKTYALAREDFFEKDVTAAFDLAWEPAAVQSAWNYREDLSSYQVRPYKGEIMSPSGVPIIRVTNDGRDNVALQVGAQVFLQDFEEDHVAVAEGFIGEDMLVRGQYFFQGWHPNIGLTLVHAQTKFHYGFLVDDDDNLETSSDQARYQGKNQQYYTLGALVVGYPISDSFQVTGIASAREYGFRTTAEAEWAPYLAGLEGAVLLNFTNISFLGRSPNPSGGRNVDLSYTHGFTDIVYEPQSGRSVDDGELLDNYRYNRVEARWTEQIGLPQVGFLKRAAQLRHTIQVDVQAGLIDRNVDLNDEFRAGGQHPYFFGSDSLRPNTLFAGYPFGSLSGETMALVNLAYRFPIRREWNVKVGPFYFYDLTAQVMGSAGNLWSFQAPDSEVDFYRNEFGERVARDASSIRREIPFVDVAYKNGNYMLFDAGGELRLSGVLMNNLPWNSFVRMVYGFNEIKGYGDVDGDDIQDTTDNAIGDELSNETEKPGVRVYVGLGTGW